MSLARRRWRTLREEEEEETESRESLAVRGLVDENDRNSRLISRANFNRKDLTRDVDEGKVYAKGSICTK